MVGASEEGVETTEEMGVAVTEALEEGVKDAVEDQDLRLEVLGVAGHTFRDIQTDHQHHRARNIIFLANQHTGVKNQQLVHGKTILYQKTSEKLTNLRLMTIF